MDIIKIITSFKENLKSKVDKKELANGEILYNQGECQILSQSQTQFELFMNKKNADDANEYKLYVEDDKIIPTENKTIIDWDRYSYACLLQIENELHLLDFKPQTEHKKYSREGMIQRVIKERQQKADKADYRIQWASNIYGDHILTNERGVKYKIFLRDFDNETGYSDSPDAKLNKLGTTKHIMYAFNQLKNDRSLYMNNGQNCPFVEIFLDPLNDYKISWFYPHYLPLFEHSLISKYFGKKKYIEDSEITSFLNFIEEAEGNEMIRIRPEVNEKIERVFESEMLKKLEQDTSIDLSIINTDLFNYQKEGIKFAVFKKAAVIADEMGLGKTLQAIGTAILKKKIFDFKRTLIVCPASIKEQWKSEIEKFTEEKALVIQGNPEQRNKQYKDENHFFYIINYETILRDHRALNNAGFDFLILDEAQRVKNYETKTSSAIKRLNPKHTLVITGTPIENKLIDIYSILNIIDPYFFGPLWNFSYQYCLFDPEKHNKINGYYNLQKLNEKLGDILVRREKRKVIDELPNLQQYNIPVLLSPLQAEYHAGYATGIAKILRKKFLTPYDMQNLQMLLAKMRMVCDSTYLVDEETNESPKLEELKYILLEQLDIRNTDRKIIIFSEWVKVHKLIGQMLRENDIGFVELNGRIPVKLRGELIRKFETNKHSKIFLSTEAGGTGLNLQVADTVINFELPWNPAKKNQRIGRIDRLGQKSNKLTIFSFISKDSIEEKIATGLLVKQNLFDGVLNDDNETNFVDFSSKGRSQFIEQLEDFIYKSQTEAQKDLYEDDVNIQDESPEQEDEITSYVETEEEKEPLAINETEKSETSELETKPTENITEESPVSKTEELEQVMNNGMQFLSGLFKMSTGKDVGFENQKIEVNKETGEVTMKFKLPVKEL